MNNRYSLNSKVCATCNFWTGQRKINDPVSRSLAECVPNTYGDCIENELRKTQKHNNASCTKWQKWSVFR